MEKQKKKKFKTLECVSVAAVTQHAKRMRRITGILSSASCLVLTYFSTLFPKLHDSGGREGGYVEQNTFVSFSPQHNRFSF